MIELIILLLAGSLDELEKEVGTDSYRTELEQYTLSHNTSISIDKDGTYSFMPPHPIENPDAVFIRLDKEFLDLYFEIAELEKMVKEHMQGCQTKNKGDWAYMNEVYSNAVFGGVC